MSAVIGVILILGTIGNILCLLTMLRLEIKRFSTKFFFLVISVSDLISFPINMAYVWTMFTFNTIPEDHSEILCKTFRFVTYSLTLVSWWVLMFISIERVLLVFVPNRMRTASQKTLAPLAVVLLTVTTVVICSVFLEFRIVNCTCVFLGKRLHYQIFAITSIASYVLITGQAILSSCILWYELKRRASRVGDVDNERHSETFSLAPFKISAGIGASQFFSMLPFFAIYAKAVYGSISLSGGTISFLFWSTFTLFFANFGANFYISAAISKRFRKTTLEALDIAVVRRVMRK